MGMSTRGTAVILGLTLAAAACGGGSEQRVVDQYFGAVNAGDNQTLSSFAIVPFNQKVQKWQVKAASPETRLPASLPELIKKGKAFETEVADNKKAWAAYRLEHAAEYNRYVELKDRTKVPANLQKFTEEWTKFEQKERDLRKQSSENKAAVEKERRNAQLSVGSQTDLDTMVGEVVEKTLELALTIDGQVKEYTMGLRKYDLQGGQGRSMSRWVVQSLQPK
jgi:hypothetical protein